MSWRCRLTPNVNNLLVFLNPKDPMCFGVRNFWRKNLPELQLLNPGVQMTIHELSFGEPHLMLSFGGTDQRVIRLAGATEEETEDIFEAFVTYAQNHAVLARGNADDGGDPLLLPLIVNFGYAESFTGKLEVRVGFDKGQGTTEGVDDPGQKARRLPRNVGQKITW